MFEERKIESLKKQVKTLSEENKELKKEIETLNYRIENMKKATEEADKYIDIMQHERAVLAEAKDKYELGYKELMKIKDEYTSKVDNMIKEFKRDNS